MSVLKALCDYYNQSKDMPLYGWQEKKIEFLIIIDKEGNLIGINSTRTDKTHIKSFKIRKEKEKNGHIVPYLFADNVEYILGYTEKEERKEKIQLKNESFINRCREVSEKYPDNAGFKAVTLFYDNNGIQKVFEHPLWEEIKKSACTLSFRLQSEYKIVAESKELENEVLPGKDEVTGIDLVTGKTGSLNWASTKIRLAGTGASGASLVSCGRELLLGSWGYEGGYNAPIMKSTENAFSQAFMKLAGRGSHNCITINGNQTYLFWSSKQDKISKEAEIGLYGLLGGYKKDNADYNIEKVQEMFKSIYSGIIKTTDEDRFYFLGTNLKTGRIPIMYWNDCSLKEFAGQIYKHLSDMELQGATDGYVNYRGIEQLLYAIKKPENKKHEINPKPEKSKGKASFDKDVAFISQKLFKAIVSGCKYPSLLYRRCLNRIENDCETTFTRTAILKGTLIRNFNQKNIKVMLNEENENPGYLCGRLFSVYVKEAVKENPKSKMSEMYFRAAMCYPAKTLTKLEVLSGYHEKKLGEGSTVYFTKIKCGIIAKLSDNKFPERLNDMEKSEFCVGYYQQREWFFTPKEEKNMKAAEEDDNEDQEQAE